MDHLQRSLLNCFSLQPLDRTAHLRQDEDWLSQQRMDRNTKFLLINNDLVVCHNTQPLIKTQAQLKDLNLSAEAAFYLGQKQQQSYFVLNVEQTQIPDDCGYCAESLRDLTGFIEAETASILAYALMLARWHRHTRFCSRCSGALMIQQGGHVLSCVKCEHTQFPRINPAVIMRVTSADKILLARQANWPTNRYSVLAGFVETGETLEHAVYREVYEEAGIEIESMHYHSSQPWPFPNSLMIGYCAQTKKTELEIENDDLETALWLNADQLIDKMDQGEVILSPPISISHRLIDDWFQQQTGQSIKAWQIEKPEHIINEE